MKLHVSMALLLLVALLLPAAAVGERLEDALLGVAQHYDPVPWAGNRTASAILTSPADLAVFDHPELSYGRTAREGGEDEEGVFCVRSKWVGFAVETLEPFEGEGYRRYTFAFARPLSRKLAAGVAYTRIGSAEGDLDGYGHWDAGAVWRPVGSLEIAANGRGLTREELGTRKPEGSGRGRSASTFPRNVSPFTPRRATSRATISWRKRVHSSGPSTAPGPPSSSEAGPTPTATAASAWSSTSAPPPSVSTTGSRGGTKGSLFYFKLHGQG